MIDSYLIFEDYVEKLELHSSVKSLACPKAQKKFYVQYVQYGIAWMDGWMDGAAYV